MNAILYVAASGCQRRTLPSCYPHGNTVHRYHLKWSENGIWERVCARLRAKVGGQEARDVEPSAGVIDARGVRGASTVTGATRGYDAGKKISGRNTFGVVDTLGLLVPVIVVAASVSDNAGGIAVVHPARHRSRRLAKTWWGGGFKQAFMAGCWAHHISAEVVNKIHARRFEVLPRRWVIERTWSWLMDNRRLQVDDERNPAVTEFFWVAHSRLLLRRLTEPAIW